jgi:predicted transcriptional regulator
MTSSDLKIDLIQKISACNDIDLLMKIDELVSLLNLNEVNKPSTVYQKEEKIFILSDEQIAIINKSIEQYKNGEFLTEEEEKKDIEKWFEEQEK